MKNYGLRPVDFELIEGTDLLWAMVPVSSNGSAEQNHKTQQRRKQGEKVISALDGETSIYNYAMQIFRAPSKTLIWDALENGDLIKVGNKSYYPSTSLEFDRNGNMLLNAIGFGWEGSHLYDNGGNVMINKEGQQIADFGYHGYMHPADSRGIYFMDIYTTRSSGGHPKPKDRKFNFLNANGETILPKNLIRSEEPVIHKFATSKYHAPCYVYDSGNLESNEHPEYFADVVDLLNANRETEIPFIPDELPYLREIITRSQEHSRLMQQLQNDYSRNKISPEDYEETCSRLQAILAKFITFQDKFISQEDIEYISSLDEGM